MKTIDRKQARRIAQEKSAAGWLIAADALEEQGDDAEAARCRIVGEVIGNIVPMLSNRKSGDGIRRFEFEAEGERFEISIMGFYSCRICIRTWTDFSYWQGWRIVKRCRADSSQFGDAEYLYRRGRDVTRDCGLNVNLPK